MSLYRRTILTLGTLAQASYSAVFPGIPVLAPQLRGEYELLAHTDRDLVERAHFTATAELAGRSRPGAALGFQQTALAVASGLAPPLAGAGLRRRILV